MPPPVRLLLVDDEAPLRAILEKRLTRRGLEVDTAEGGASARERLRENHYDVALLDLAMPDIDGITLLREIRADWPGVECIMLTGQGTIETAIEAMKLGAYDYLEKPGKVEQMELIIRKAAEKSALARENLALRRTVETQHRQMNMVGECEAIAQLRKLIADAAPTDATVLIEGESGSGKELVAHAIYQLSQRKAGPYLAINCGALHESLLEAELFGHVKGAFTGADATRAGVFEACDGGTLFIDEVGEMAPQVQVRFLRVLDRGQFQRVGESTTRRADVRILAATNRNLQADVETGRFRQDLYYRLNVFRIEVPPLRERIEDIPLLAEHFLRDGGTSMTRNVQLTPEATKVLLQHDWPGNVRELANVVERAAIVCEDGLITPDDLPPEVQDAARRAPPARTNRDADQTLEAIERQHIAQAMEHEGGNKTRAAARLGISTRNLYRKLERYGLA